MKRLVFFIFAIFTITHAFAESFPNDEIMLQNKTYDNAAVYTNMGVYNGDVTADAQYDWDLFSPTAGNYLPKNSTTITQCTSGNFCIGATNIHYDADNDQGITSCSTLGDNSYTQSASGSSTDTQCYKNCTPENANIAHAATVSGNDYYGNGTDTCTVTTCERGYNVNSGACAGNTLNITWTGLSNETVSNANAGTCTYGGAINVPPEPPHIPGKRFVGWKIQLPYTKIEYIESTGTEIQYIDTGVHGDNNNLNFIVDFMVLNLSQNRAWHTLFANYIDEEHNIWRVLFNRDQGLYVYSNTRTGYGVKLDTIQLNQRYLIDLKYGEMTLNGTKYVMPERNMTIGTVNNRTIDIFYRNGVPVNARIYSFKIYDNGTLIRDFIPVKDSNGVVCMYDRVGKQFYYNAGTGDFIAGPDL